MLPIETPNIKSFKTATPAQEGLGCKITADLTVSTAGAGERTIGIYANNDDANAETAVYTIGGSARALSGATFNAGDLLKTNANGKWIATTTADDEVGAIAATAATAVDQLVEVQIISRKV